MLVRGISSCTMPTENNGRVGPSATTPNNGSSNRMEDSAMFVSQNWHKPYGEALLEPDPVKLPEAIAVAKREILTRYLAPSRVSQDEHLDLSNAVAALSHLKKSHKIT
jgi:hypothetical protein